ncbi:hypothetical protein BH24GEM3_BH24GEM3_27050 [soil metagenome]
MSRSEPAAPHPAAANPPEYAAAAAAPRRCRNCGETLTGRYCARCGQRATEVTASLRALARDFADEYLNVDSKILKSILALLLRPGYLTREYLQGRRVRYVRPLRLYFVASVLFFLTLSFVQPLSDVFEDDPEQPMSVEEAIRMLSEDQAPTASPEVAPPTEAGEEPAMQAPVPPQVVRVGPWEVDVTGRMERIRRMSPAALLAAFADGFERYLPRLMFVLLPLFALLLKLLYLRQRRFYAEHFIFALHFHAFIFGSFALLLLLPSEPWTPLIVLWMHLYLWVAIKYVYRQSWLMTSAKFVLLFSSYSLALATAFTTAVLLILLLV